jgi:hypothetical protein
MAGAPDLESALTRLVQQLDGRAATGCSLLLYGSAARGDYDAQRSDVNLLLVVDDPSPTALTALRPALKGWHDAGFTPPLLIGRDEWRRATDVFPIELTDMRLSHRVLAGVDPLAGQVVAPEFLRAALESALRGKLVRLRQAFVRFHDAMPILGGFAASSCSELLVLLRCTAVLLGRDPGRSAASAVDALEHELGESATAVRMVAAHRRDPDWACPPELFAQYLVAVQRAADLADTTSTGAS